MGQGISTAIQAAVARLLKPLVRLMLRNGVSYGVFADIAKRVYVEVAMQEFAIPGRKPTISRASVITGLTRKEVQRVSQLPPATDSAVQDRYNRAVRVLSGWSRDPAYLDAAGQPRPLPLEGATGSFTALVRRYSGDAPVRAVLDELERVGAVERTGADTVRLVEPAYVPAGEAEDKLAILGSDVSDLIATIDHNLVHAAQDSRLQLRVAYDNLPREALEQVRRLSSEQGFALLQGLDRELARHDRDANPAVQGSGRMRAGVSVFYFEDEVPDANGEARG